MLRIAKRLQKKRQKGRELNVETEFDHVAVFDDVIFSFDPELAGFARLGERAERDQIVEVMSEDNGEYLIKLRDGSDHRCSRTYSRILSSWIQPQKV